MIIGCDVSESNPTNGDWTASGCRFLYVKSSEGCTYRDPRCVDHVLQGARDGVPVGLYHVWRFNGRTPEEQVKHLLSSRPSIGWPTLPLMIDVEREWDKAPGPRAKHLKEGLRLLRSELALVPFLYTSPGYWAGMGSAGVDEDFAKHPLWLATYHRPLTTNDPPAPCKPWSKVAIWQFGGDANYSKIAGVDGYIDQNLFMGGEIEFDRFLSGKELPTSEPEYRHA